MEIANRMADKSPIALSLAKEAIKLASRSNLDEGLRREVDLFALCFSSADKDEGVKAFLESASRISKGSSRESATLNAEHVWNLRSQI